MQIADNHNIKTVFIGSCVAVVSLFVTLWTPMALIVPIIIAFVMIFGYNIVKRQCITIDLFDCILGVIILYEMINCFQSIYRFNSYIEFVKFVPAVMLFLIIKQLIKYSLENEFFILCVCVASFVLVLLNTPYFAYKYTQAQVIGFDDYSQIRFLYNPLGFLSNEWVTILFCILPFPIICFLSKRKNINLYPSIKDVSTYMLLILLFLIVVNILMTFSRAAYLTLFLFVLFVDLGVYFTRQISFNRFLLLNGVFVLCILFFIFIFPEGVSSTIFQTESHFRSIDGRLNSWVTSFNIFQDHSMFGVGTGNFPLMHKQYQLFDIENSFSSRTNNTFLQILVEKGGVGFSLWVILFVTFFFYMGRTFWKIQDNKYRLSIIVISISVISILFRELFFNSLFRNMGILLFTLIIMNQYLVYPKINISLRKIKTILLGFFFIANMIFVICYYICMNEITSYNSLLRDYETNNCVNLNHVNSVSTCNSLFYSLLGTIIMDGTSTNINKLIINDSISLKSSSSLKLQIDSSLYYFRRAVQLNPNEDLFYHNMGWLYMFQSKRDSALYYMSKACKLDPNNPLHYLSRGLIVEPMDSVFALSNYQKAVLLSPDVLDSEFFLAMKRRKSSLALELLNSSEQELNRIYMETQSVVVRAKLGKLLIYKNDSISARQTFLEIVDVLPNLSRPWYYLGNIDALNGRDSVAIYHYRKSIFLDSKDYLPIYALAKTYNELGDTVRSGIYLKRALAAYNGMQSMNSTRSSRIYYLETMKNDIIPRFLLNYVKPSMDSVSLNNY